MFSIKNISLIVGFFPMNHVNFKRTNINRCSLFFFLSSSLFLSLLLSSTPFAFLLPLLESRGMNSYLSQRREKLYREKVKLAVKGMSNLSMLILESD